MRLLAVLLLSTLFFLWTPIASAVECEDQPGDNLSQDDLISFWSQAEEACKRERDKWANEAQTLEREIGVISSKISLAQAQINQTQAQINQLEEDITVLSGVLENVNLSMDQLAQIYVSRVRESYRRYRVNKLDMVLTTDFSDFMEKLKYLNTIKTRDQLILTELEKSRLDYGEKKEAKIEKQQEIENLKIQLLTQKRSLDSEQAIKQKILKETQNNEAKFQEILSKVQQEKEAIENIMAGKGVEEEVRDVSAGEKIASVIQGSSCNSNGSHLHFIVSRSNISQNPFNYLKSVDYRNCSGSSCGSGDGDSFNPSGSWDWPIPPQITLNQGYGVTWAVKNTWVKSIYDFHNGIDIKGSSYEVRAVQAGKLYRGSYSGSCNLKYVRVKHKDDGLDTLYLHVNYF